MFPSTQPTVLLSPPTTQGANYRAKAAGEKLPGEVALVLGAGNQTPVACMDILHKLLLDDAVVVCKMNPVNEYLGPYIRRADCSPALLIFFACSSCACLACS